MICSLGIKPSIEVTHLQFTNDATVQCDADKDQTISLNMVLRWFEIVSGLKINYTKYKMSSARTESDQGIGSANSFGCRVGSLPSFYMGPPLCSRQSDILVGPSIEWFKQDL